MVYPANNLKNSSPLLLRLALSILGLLILSILLSEETAVWLIWLILVTWLILAVSVDKFFRSQMNQKRQQDISAVWRDRVDAARLEKIVKENRLEIIKKSEKFVILQIEASELYKGKDPRITELSFYVLSEMLNKDFLPFLRSNNALLLEVSPFSVTLLFDQGFFEASTKDTHLSSVSNAQLAFDCAAKLQSKLIKFNTDNRQKLMPIVPLSIHLCLHQLSLEYSAYQFHLDPAQLQVYKSKVKPLVSSGENFLIMMTTDFAEKLNHQAQDLFYEKYLITENESAFFKIYEYLDKSLQTEKDTLETTLNSFLHYRRKDERFYLNKQFSVQLQVQSLDAKGSVLNFSKNGLMVQLDKCIGRTCKILLDVSSESASMREHFVKIGLQTMEAEVRYEMHNGKDQFIHGLKLISANQTEDQNLFFKALLPYKA